MGLLLGAMLFIGHLFDNQALEETKTTISADDLESAKTFASEFITADGTFGMTEEAIEAKSFPFLKNQLANNLGTYNNASFGLSRGERYEKLLPSFDPNGEEDVTEYFSNTLNGYYPDWSGQLTSYSVSDVLMTPGETYLKGDTTLLPLTVSFTSKIKLFSDADVTSNAGAWKEYQGDTFVTVKLVLSQQALGTWKVWSIEDPTDAPYLLATWAKPDWKTSAPSKETLLAVE